MAKLVTQTKHGTAPPRSSQEFHTIRGGRGAETRTRSPPQRSLCREVELTAINFSCGSPLRTERKETAGDVTTNRSQSGTRRPEPAGAGSGGRQPCGGSVAAPGGRSGGRPLTAAAASRLEDVDGKGRRAQSCRDRGSRQQSLSASESCQLVGL